MSEHRVILEVGGPEFLGWWILANVLVVGLSLAIVHGLEILTIWVRNRRRQQ
jgi:hypothetical protein